MKKDLTEVVFILDRSGSMGGLESDTIGGFNSMIAKQKKEEGEAIITTVLFDDKIEILHDRLPVNKVDTMNDKQYYVRGCTALLDAVGTTISHIKKTHKQLADNEKPDKTLFIITTDGYENASREYTYDKVKKMIEKQKEKHDWEFLFLGANIDAVEVGSSFGISADRAINYHCDSAGTELNFNVLSATVSAVRKSRSKKERARAMESCCEAISKDYTQRR